MNKPIPTIILLTITAILALLLVKGQIGLYNRLHFQYDYDTIMGGPFEGSNSNSRYALTEAIAKDSSIFFSAEQAEFSSPDLVYYHNNYFSIFTPGVSFLGVPFYMIGLTFGAPQLFSYLSTLLLAVLNVYLVYKLSEKLGAGKSASLFSGFIFLFTTDAIAYALTYTQHHLSTAVVILAILNAFEKRSWKNNIVFGVIFGVGLLADIPNGLMLLPILGYVLLQNFDISNDQLKMGIRLNWKIIGLVLGIAPLMITFGLYNYGLTGSPITLGQTLGRIPYERTLLPAEEIKDEIDYEEVDFNSPLDLEDIPRGFYILALSSERGFIFYSPVMLIGIVGLYLLWKKNKMAGYILAVMGADLLIYSMFGDPWGGWSFGPRYLIPASALASSGVALMISHYKHKAIFNWTLLVLVIYGLAISILGAMTTNGVPPKVEAISLPDPVPYTYAFNWQVLETGKSSSLFYDVYLKNIMPADIFYFIYVSIVAICLAIFYFLVVRQEKIKPAPNA